MNKSMLSLCAVLFIGSLSNIAHADIKKTIKGTVKKGVLEEFAGELAKLPGLKQIKNSIDSNEFKLVSTNNTRGVLKVTNFNDVEVMTISRKRYKPGLKMVDEAVLTAGTYWLKAQPKDNKKQAIERKVLLSKGSINKIELNFWQKGIKVYPLEITTVPQSAKIRILNIIPKYKFAMPLEQGRYTIEVSHNGYKKAKFNVTLDHNQNNFPIKLQSLITKSEKTASTTDTAKSPEVVKTKKEYSLGVNIATWGTIFVLTVLALWIIYRLLKFAFQLFIKIWRMVLDKTKTV